MMAKADCGFCEAAGHRACDLCGGVVFEHNTAGLALGIDMCGYCEEDRVKTA